MKPYGIIYLITNKITGKKYVGQTIHKLKDRWNWGHCSKVKNKSEYYIHRAIRKYGVENFKIEQILECYSKEMLTIMETFKIMVNHSHCSEGGYNLTWGGEDNPMFNPEIIKKSVNNRPSFVGKNNPMYGRKHTDEAKKKIREIHKGKIVSEETRRKMSEAKKGITFTKQHKERISEARKKIKNKISG